MSHALKLALCASASMLTLAAVIVTPGALANPQGGEVVSGTATITTPTTTTTQINQESDKAIIDWQSFNVGHDESTVFVQPTSTSVTLNRIFDNDPSIISGLVSANGRLILINRNGMVFESGAQVNTAGLIATTADIRNEDFLASRYNFDIAGSPNAQISNAGLITAEEGGVVAFVAPSIKNSGVITAKLGRVALGSGNTFVLDLYGDNLISFPVSAEIAQQLTGPDGQPISSLIDVSGKIDAGTVQLTARAARGIIDKVINVDGEIIASGIKQSGASVSLTGGGQTSSPAGTTPAIGTGVSGTYGAAIVVDGGANGDVAVAGSLTASGGQGGSVTLTGENVHASGAIAANGQTAQGGSVSITASNFASLTGSISANGKSGGSVSVSAGNLLTAGSISANGASGAGGTVSLTAANRQIASTATQVSANGARSGGSITINGGSTEGGGLFTSGTYSATSSFGTGGNVTVGGRDINMIDSHVDASGAAGGGNIAVGFTGAGDTRAINADNILISPTSTFNADATGSGNGGSVMFWSNVASDFMGTVTAKGGSLAGDGGLLEVSSKGEVGFWGLGDASAANGLAGTLTLDPKNLIVSTAGSAFPSYELIDPGTGSSSFGANLAVLSTGNTVVTSTGDDTAATNAGAVFVFNTTTGALVSMLTGSRTNDNVGNGGITVLTNGNFVVTSADWDNGAAIADAGAATWINGTSGLAGVISAANSLVGSAAGNQVGNAGVTALTNGNYVVRSTNWDNGAITNVGAVTWGNGATGTVGNVTTVNSLVGSTANDSVGLSGVVALANGNYVVRSQLWNNGAIADAGAVTWGNGLGGTAGSVTALNSLVGSTANDQIGSSGVTALTNGNYAVASSQWDNGASANAGAVTFGNGAGGTVGAITAANSLVGTAANNEVGNGGVVALSNGNYAAISSNWDNGATTNVGAVTWGNGGGGTVGAVGAGNSLVGSQANDNVGSGGVTALTNGNYVVRSMLWNNGATADVGAVTWRNGAGAFATSVSAANSFIGSAANDQVGSNGVRALSNGNYVVASSLWNNGGTTDAGAVTWGNGTTGALSTGLFGTLSNANSLVGTGTNNNVGSGGVVALTNGNYVAVSPGWDNGGGGGQGAVTWGNGATGTAGNVGVGNSLVGSNTNDNVGSGGVFALTNGNYVVASPNWDNGGDTNTGAVTWRSGAAASNATVSAANSLIGSNDDDNVGSGGVAALANGNYVVSSPNWDNGFDNNTGAVALGNGTTGTVGELSATNAIIGTNDNTALTYAGSTATNEILARSTSEGLVLVGLTDPNQLTFARAQGQTLTVNPAFLTNTLNTGTAVALQASNDLTISSAITVNNPSGNGGALTLQAGRSVLINANITTDNGNLTVVANELLANGVINAQRDAGAAVITMAAGTTINAGTGNVRMTIASGAGKTNLTSGTMTLRAITAGTIIAENLGTTAGSNIAIASGTLSASGTGTPLVLASQVGNFVNSAGAGALSAPNGRWIVYSQNPAANTLGGITGGSPFYNTPYNSANPTGLSASGNRFAYTVAPVLTVTPNNQSRVYGDANAGLTFAVTGLLGTDTLAGAVQGAPDLATTATPTSSVAGGPYPITASIGTLASDYNYGFSFGQGLLTITPAQLFYLADAKTREYGDPNGVLTGTVTGLKNGELFTDVTTGALTFTGTADNLSNVGIYGITGSGLTVTSGNYQGAISQAAANATALNVTPAQLFYTADSVSRTYGDFNPSFTGDITGVKNGESLDDITDGSFQFNSIADETFDVGSYAITAGGLTVVNSNYMPTVLQNPLNATALTITPATLFYLAFGDTRVYGDPDPVYAGTVEGLTNGDTLAGVTTGTAAFATTATATTGVGDHPIFGSGLTLTSNNYVLAQDPSNATALAITPAQLSYLANAATREYGDPNPAFTGQVIGMKNGETLESLTSGALTFVTSATATTGVGPVEINGQGLTVTSGNYMLTIDQDPFNATALFIDPARLFYVADPKSRIYGDLNPSFTGQVTGLKNGDTLEDVTTGDLQFDTDIDASADVGTYGIFGFGLTTVSPNYQEIILQAPTNETALTITQAQLFYLANNSTSIYGDAIEPVSGDLIGLKNGDAIEVVTSGTMVFTADATQLSNAGTHAINGSGLTVVSGNYLIDILQDPTNVAAYMIDQAQLTYVADAATREYGDANPTFTGQVVGLKNGETLGSVTSGTLVFLSPATPTSPIANYDINGGGLTVTSGNYITTIDQDPGNEGALTVTQAQLTYVADSKVKTYGENNPLFTGTLTGLKNGDTLESVTSGSLVWISDGGDGADAGIYSIFGDGLNVINSNYFVDILQAPGNETAFTVNQAQLIYRADTQSRIFGFPDPIFTGQLVGLANGDSLENVTTGDLVFTPTATAASPAGTYAINGGGLIVASGNYVATILQDPGNATAFTIIPIPLTKVQVQQEAYKEQKSAIDEADGLTPSRDNDLNIEGIDSVSGDLDDGKNDEMAGQLCVLGTPEAGKSAKCNTDKATGN